MASVAGRLARIHGDLCDGELTDTEAGKRAERALARVKPGNVRAAYWAGRIEEATGIQVWPYAT